MSATVPLTIAGRTYEIACDAGQEAALESFSVEIDRRATEILKAIGPVADARLLVMVALTLVDDLTEARKAPGTAPVADDESDAKLAAGLDRLTDRIESIADRLRKA